MIYSSRYDNKYLDCSVKLAREIKNMENSNVVPDVMILRIPMAYARMESNKVWYNDEEIKNIPHYVIAIPKQEDYGIKDSLTYKEFDTLVFFRKSNEENYRMIILYGSGGVNFPKYEHKYLIHETDELDRRIIKGFCDKYQYEITRVSLSDNPAEERTMLVSDAHYYRCNMQPKRIKSGPNKYYNENVITIKNDNIFKDVQFI